MLNENAKKWVEALRSGDYEQTIGVLRRENNRRCCLGVACDLFAKETSDGEWAYKDDGYKYFVTERYLGHSLLPIDVRDWLGLTSSKGQFIDGSLTNLNDEGSSFNQIADMIESEPDGLFLHHE